MTEEQRIKFEYETIKVLPELYYDKLTEAGLHGWEFCFLIIQQEVKKSIITDKHETVNLFYITLKRIKL